MTWGLLRRHNSRMSLRWRITLLATVLLVIALALLGSLGAEGLWRLRLSSLDHDLSVQYNVLSETVRENADGRIPSSVITQLASSADIADARIRSGSVIVWSLGHRGLPTDIGDDIATVNNWRMLAGTVGDFRLEIGRPLLPVQETLRDYGLAVLPLALIIALAGAVTVYLAVGRALAPLTALTTRVRQLDTPAPVPGVHRQDETGQLARALDDSLQALERTRDTEKLFLAAASHELRTPVTALRAELEFALARARDADAYRDALRRTLRTTTHLERLTVNLLTMTRLRAMPARHEQVDLWELAADTVDRLMPLALSRGVTLDLAGAPTTVGGDPMLLERAIENLVYNAVRYAPGGCVLVTAEGHRFSVEDDGPGFPPGFTARLYDSTDGHGVGLALVRNVAQAHQATLVLENRPGGGACARMVFPEAGA